MTKVAAGMERVIHDKSDRSVQCFLKQMNCRIICILKSAVAQLVVLD